MSDTDMVQAALISPEAFSEIITRYRLPLLRYIQRLGADTHSAEDILQDVFISVYKNLNSYNTDLAFSSWIYRIAHNKTISAFRSASYRNHLSFDSDEYTTLAEHITIDTTESLDITDKDLIRKALEALSPQYREIIVLYYLEEKSYEEISDILQKPPGTVATLLYRAKKNIQLTLSKHFYE